MSRKIAIFGTTPSRMEGPWQDDSGWERWTIGPGGKDHHNWERLYEVHTTWPEDFKGYLDDLSKVELPKQVVTMGSMPELIRKWAKLHGKDDDTLKAEITGDWSANVIIPREALIERFIDTVWFSSSISWLIAQAIDEGATDIGLWGIDLESGEEYISQWVGCKHFINIARLLGINIHLPPGCGLLRDFAPYPDRYETHFALTLEKKKKWLDQNFGPLEADVEGSKMLLHRAEGRLFAYREMGKETDEIEQELAGLSQQLSVQTANLHTLRGERSATDYYYRMYVIGLNETT